MKKHIITAYLLLMCGVSAIKADTFTINGREINVPSPNGFVRVTDDMTAVNKLVQQMADPMNDTLAFYIDESEVPAAKAGKIPNLERTFILKVNKQLRTMTVGKNDFSQLKDMTKDQNQKLFKDIKSKISEQMENVSQGVSQEFNVDFAMNISRMVPLEPHHETENTFAYSMYINYGVKAGEETTQQIVVATSTLVNASGVVLFLYGYAPEHDLQWTRDASMDWEESVMSSNVQPPAKSPGGRGINWNQVMEKGVIGAIAGGLVALIAGAVSRFKRKKG